MSKGLLKVLKIRKMNNLLERLKPEFQAKLKEATKDYDEIFVIMVNRELNQKEHWHDLTYFSIVELVNWLELPDYNPSTIDELFENK